MNTRDSSPMRHLSTAWQLATDDLSPLQSCRTHEVESFIREQSESCHSERNHPEPTNHSLGRSKTSCICHSSFRYPRRTHLTGTAPERLIDCIKYTGSHRGRPPPLDPPLEIKMATMTTKSFGQSELFAFPLMTHTRRNT